MIIIPVTAALLGPYNYRHAARYAYWRGELKIKIVVNNSYGLNGNFVLIHSDYPGQPGLDLSKFVTILGNIPTSVSGAPGEALVMQCVWRDLAIRLPVDLTSTNGYLTLAIPTVSQASSEASHVISIYSDVSSIEYFYPKEIVSADGDYLPPDLTLYTRAAPPGLRANSRRSLIF